MGITRLDVIFAEWERLDRLVGLRWGPEEAKRHAYQWNAPTDEQPKTQYGAAVVGLAALTAVPVSSARHVSLVVLGGQDNGVGFSFAWPIWRAPASMAAIRGLLSHCPADQPRQMPKFHLRRTRSTTIEFADSTVAGRRHPG